MNIMDALHSVWASAMDGSIGHAAYEREMRNIGVMFDASADDLFALMGEVRAATHGPLAPAR